MSFAKGPFFSLIAGAVVFGPSCFAQQALETAPGGIVTGHVTCSDTQRPARFAQVMLFGVPKEVTSAPKLDAGADSTQIAAAIKAGFGQLSKLNMVQTQTGIDGGFSAAGVAPGDYYVFGSVAGYVQPKNIVQAAYDAGADLSKPIPGVPIVHVVAERSTQADVTVDRGAAISGRVIWDDGSPVARAIVTVISAKGKSDELPREFSLLSLGSAMMGGGGLASISDDLGHFRIAGLAPGDYFVKATFQTSSQFAMQGGAMNFKSLAVASPLVVFAPAALHQVDAKSVTLHAAEDRGDEEVTINLSGMRVVSGRVASLEDHHGLNSASVKLQDAQDKDLVRSSDVDTNGNFSVTFVPPGTYNLLVTDGADTEPAKKDPSSKVKFPTDHTLRSYQDGKQSVVVGENDVTGLSIELAPAKTVKKEISLDDLIKN